MKINKENMLYDNFSIEESKEMLSFARELISSGNLPYPLPKFVDLWMNAFSYTEDQKYLLLATSYPQKLLLSLIVNDPTQKEIN